MQSIHRSKGSRAFVLASSITLVLSSVGLIAAPVLATEQCTPTSTYTETELRTLIRTEGSSVSDPQNANGSSATTWSATVAIPDDLCDVEVSLSSYSLPGGSMHPFEDQELFDNVTAQYAGGSSTSVGVDLPAGCGWQVDLYLGPVIANLHPSYGHPGSKLIDWSLNQTREPCQDEVEPTPTPTEEEPEDDDASLNVRKVDEQGNRLAGAVFSVEGMDGTFTTGPRGNFCITGLDDDSEWLVTEITAPDGYEIAAEASQWVEVDDDGDCNSPSAVFVNTRADEEPSEEPSESPDPTDSPKPSTTPREGELGGTPTPKPSGGDLPDTAIGQPTAPVNVTGGLALIAVLSLGALVRARLLEARARR